MSPNAIAPCSDDTEALPLPQPSDQLQHPVVAFLAKAKRIWNSLQISHSGGKYSVERLLALEEYARTTSLTRVLLVCIGTPLPMAIVIILQECAPLRDPSEGWSANYGFWIRAGVLGGIVAVGMAAFALSMIPGVVLSNLQLALLCIGTGVSYPFAAMLVAALWVFPIPFMILTIISLYVTLFAGFFWLIVGKDVISEMGKHTDELILAVSFSGSQCMMAFVYAFYAVLFDHAANTHFEVPVILLLPIIKIIMKNLVSRTIVHMKDMAPEAVIFTVDFFNSMYLATCMQNASSITTVLTMMAIDITQTIFELRSLYYKTSTIVARLEQANGSITGCGSLLPAVESICRDTTKFALQARENVILDSCLPHKLSAEGRTLLETLKSVPGNGVRSIPRFSVVELRDSFRSAVTQTSVKPLRRGTKEGKGGLDMIATPHKKILSETLEVLFTTECVVLTEYLESIIPVLYGNFVLLVVHLPSARYHKDLVGITPDNVGGTVSNIFILATLEFASFIFLVFMMMKNCRLKALYHLAFVLETQMLLIQVKLVTWVLMSFSFRVEHFGVDFTFKFAWMNQGG
ncbi:hypothetical protein PHYSODRAFT_501338 [Phytophthora sojae]|uniref:Uncharacterized protein n=1 Tax=Phytophthora sojae (strain P6497) TaxID=1094619 RepID=G4ZJL4_PHYSP|nr:hypothetical protein PHYSODRAFT_501338 [Phytophthora sojae]EGZ18234.1 hypothetical protein PHYSODRAFT_501338 [Phytophthora sojae]|eukprot:XP_009527292.1 hypothetical protein PHYSODRAFT_501338 [Phytophthora sojae]